MVTDISTRLDLVRDFVNTFDLETSVDRIATPEALAEWYSEEGLVDDLVEPTRQEHADALAVREAIRQLLLAHNGCEDDAAAASATLETAGRQAGIPYLVPQRVFLERHRDTLGVFEASGVDRDRRSEHGPSVRPTGTATPLRNSECELDVLRPRLVDEDELVLPRRQVGLP